MNNITLIMSLVISISLNLFYLHLIDKKRKEILEILEKFKKTLERENYLLKMINDSMNVTNIRGFIMQRMSMVPKSWEPKTEEEINRDIID